MEWVGARFSPVASLVSSTTTLSTHGALSASGVSRSLAHDASHVSWISTSTVAETVIVGTPSSALVALHASVIGTSIDVLSVSADIVNLELYVLRASERTSTTFHAARFAVLVVPSLGPVA